VDGPGGLRHRTALGIAVAGVLLLLASFLPWFEHVYALGDADGVRTERTSAGAWGSSVVWSLAVLCGVAAGGWAALLARGRSRSRYVDLGLLLLSAAGLALCLGEVAHVVWVSIWPGEQVIVVSLNPPPPEVQRGQLYLHHGSGERSWFSWGLLAGLALLGGQVLLAARSLLAGRAARTR